MQAIDLFGLLVAAVGAIHLFNRSVVRLTGVRRYSRPKIKSSPIVRKDWYVFFCCSSLYGNQRAGRGDEGAAGQLNRHSYWGTRAGSQRVRPRATLSH